MQQHLYQAQIRLRRYKRRVWPPYVAGEAAQLLTDGRHGRQVQAVSGRLQRHPLEDPVGPGRCLAGGKVGQLFQQRPVLNTGSTVAAEIGSVELNHGVDRVLSFLSSRRNWDYPTPSHLGECLVPRVSTFALAKGGEVSHLQRGDRHCITLGTYVLCELNYTTFFIRVPSFQCTTVQWLRMMV